MPLCVQSAITTPQRHVSRARPVSVTPNVRGFPFLVLTLFTTTALGGGIVCILARALCVREKTDKLRLFIMKTTFELR